MQDAKSIEAEREQERGGETATSNAQPLAQTIDGPPNEPPPSYNAVQMESSSMPWDAPPETPKVVFNRPQFEHGPTQCTCPRCMQPIVTRVSETNGIIAWVLCLILIFLGCWLGCCLIPFCIKDLKTTIHYCPNCGAEVGRKEFL